MCCGKVLEGVQLWRNADLGEAGRTEIAPRLPLPRRDWSWKLSNIYNTKSFPGQGHFYKSSPSSGGSRTSRRRGANLIGGINSRRAYTLKNVCVKTKELEPLRGARAGCAPLLGSANVTCNRQFTITLAPRYSRPHEICNVSPTEVH